MNAAETIAANNVASEVAALACSLSVSPKTSPADACATQYITNRGKQLFRRPLSTTEISGLYTVYLAGFQNPYASTPATNSGIELTLTAMLQSPGFLYRTELGDPNDTTSPLPSLTQYEIASGLSYLASASPPDATLMTAATNGTLTTPAALQAQFQRIIATPAGQAQMARFVAQWVGADMVVGLGNSSGPITPTIASEMYSETQAFVENVLFNSTGTLNELLTANYTFLNSDLAQYYGVNGSLGTNFSKIVPSPSQRPTAGLLSQGSFLASSAATGGVPLLHRGHLIRSQFFCQTLPSFASLGLPGFTPPTPPPLSPGETTRQMMTTLIPPVSGNTCYTCHQYFMPMGFGLESYDLFGKFRLTENGGTIDPSGWITDPTSTDPATGTIQNPISPQSTTNFSDSTQLGASLAAEPAVQACFPQQALIFASGRNNVLNNECAIGGLQTQFQASGGNILSVFSNFIQSTQFTLRGR